MTPELRAKLAAKYNMRAEDYFPGQNTKKYAITGDYPLLNHESADSRCGSYNWDNYDLRSNYGDPVPFDQLSMIAGMPSTTAHINYAGLTDFYRSWRAYYVFVILVFLLYAAEFYSFQILGWGSGGQGARHSHKCTVGGDGFVQPYNLWNNGCFNWAGGHYSSYKHDGATINREDDGWERWGIRRQIAYTIDGWEDLDRVPDYWHQF